MKESGDMYKAAPCITKTEEAAKSNAGQNKAKTRAGCDIHNLPDVR